MSELAKINKQYDGRPFMKTEEIRFIEETISSMNKSKINIFEWGAGGSTKYFMNFLINRGSDFQWHSTEHNPNWAKKVMENINDERLTLRIYDYKAYTRDQTRKLCMKEYVFASDEVSDPIDLFLIDGRSRSRCLLEVKKKIRKEGFVFLHDCDRVHYYNAMKEFEEFKVVNRIWRGKI